MFDPNELKQTVAPQDTPQPAPKEDRNVYFEPLTEESFAEFGDVLAAEGTPDRLVDRGRCGRYDDRAMLDFSNGRPAMNMLLSEARKLPIKLNMVLRHPKGTKCVMPMTQNPFLVIVSPSIDGEPGPPRAFLTKPGQGVNYHRGVWHHILTPLVAPGLFCVLDRADKGPNLDEHWFDRPYMIAGPRGQ